MHSNLIMWLSVLIFGLQILGTPSSPLDLVEPRMVGSNPVVPVLGSPSKPNPRRFAFQVSIRRKTKHVCGGSIISSTKVLTAAHCISPEGKPLNIKVGIYDYIKEPGQNLKVSTITIHPEYDAPNLLNDLAILNLSSPIIFNHKTQKISLRAEAVQPDEDLIVSGWGRTKPRGTGTNILNYLNVRATNNKTCKHILRKSRYPITPSQICAKSSTRKGTGTCKGDSGGPLIDQQNNLVGVVSWGKGCAKGYPDIYTSVAYHYKWIQRQI